MNTRLTANDLLGAESYKGYTLGWTPFSPMFFALDAENHGLSARTIHELKERIDGKAGAP